MSAPPPVTADSGGAVTFEVTPRLSDDGSAEPLLTIPAAGEARGGLSVVQDGSQLRVVFVDESGAEFSAGTSIAAWMPGEAHVITTTWSGSQAEIYIDGVLVGQQTIAGAPPIRPGAPVFIGSEAGSPPTMPSAGGTIGNFQVYPYRLTPGQVAQLSAPPDSATLRVRSPTLVGDAGAATVCVDLENGANVIAGTQNELAWDSDCAALVSSCTANPQHGKQVRTHQIGSKLRTLVVSLTDTAPIPDGELYCCPFTVRLAAVGSCCPIQIEDVLASDSRGQKVPIAGVSGLVCR